MTKRTFAHLFGITLALYAIFAIMQGFSGVGSITAAAPEPDFDMQLLKIGLFYGEELNFARILALHGDWKAILHHAPPATFSGPLLSQESVLTIPEGEHLSIEVSPRGIVGKLSTGEELNAGYTDIVLYGGEFVEIETGKLRTEHRVCTGRIEVDLREKKLNMVNTLTTRHYLQSAVSRIHKMSEPESIKAMITIARTIAWYAKVTGRHASDAFHLCDSDHCLPFSGSDEDRRLVSLLVDRTRDEVVTYQGRPFWPYFHHTCGGYTASAKDVFGISDIIHVAKQDRIPGRKEDNCFHSPAYSWMREFTKENMAYFLNMTYAAGVQGTYLRWEPVLHDANGRILSVKLSGRKERILTGVEFLRDVKDYFGPRSLRSLAFQIEPMKRSLVFIGRGHGHGIGMCQWGSDGMAKSGKNYREILEFYYRGSVVNRINNWQENTRITTTVNSPFTVPPGSGTAAAFASRIASQTDESD